MRIATAAAGMAATGLVAGGVLVMAAKAETPATPVPASAPLRTVSVQGVANEPLSSAASSETATTVYRQAMAAAISDGQAKAQFLAEKAGATLGQVQSIGEGGGYIECPEGEEYQGGQPDFGSGASVSAGVLAPAAAGRATPTIHKAPAKKPAAKHHKRRSAKQAAAESCTLSTQVSLVYQLS
jgi:hypothetical protein